MRWQAISLVLGLACLLAACSDYKLTGSTPLGRDPAPRSEPPIAVAGPATLLQARLAADGRQGSFAKVARTGDYETWRAADGSALALRGRLVTATYSLGNDLYSADVRDTLDRLQGRGAGEALRVHRYLDGENQIVTRAFRCIVRKTGSGGLVIAREACQGADIGFENRYTLTPSGRILTSRQWIGPEVGAIDLSWPQELGANAPRIVAAN
ncbi:MAG: YjbF family lipoprotein [Paracoccaceae bacterium]|nr:YjbF family lipoprotein [Paracoccaceae bacterium]